MEPTQSAVDPVSEEGQVEENPTVPASETEVVEEAPVVPAAEDQPGV